ncbi:NAD-P-binding protein [Lactarius vividus]|nr:NAD-P-binding protein [Lactarius vividus]
MTTILVTGASGFVGSHVISELLRGGYTVRGAVRSHNVTRVNKSYESFGDKFSVTVIDDLITSDLSDAVKGVDAIIHVASALPNANPDVVLDAAVTGTTRILGAAVAANIKKLVITESVVSLALTGDFWKDLTITEESYTIQTREDAHKPGVSVFDVYAISKSLSDRAVRDFKRAHPDFDVTSIHPSFIYGPVGLGQVYDKPATGSNLYVYGLISGPPGRPVSGYDPASAPALLSVDVRDVARAHVLALKLPHSETQKRFTLSTNTFTWKDATEVLAEKRPELKGRLPVITGKEPPVGPVATLDTSNTKSVLGLKNPIKWQDTVLDTIDDMLRLEKELGVAT